MNYNSPFMRGSMSFDDYNYRMHNEYILKLDPKDIVAAGGKKPDFPLTEEQKIQNERLSIVNL